MLAMCSALVIPAFPMRQSARHRMVKPLQANMVAQLMSKLSLAIIRFRRLRSSPIPNSFRGIHNRGIHSSPLIIRVIHRLRSSPMLRPRARSEHRAAAQAVYNPDNQGAAVDTPVVDTPEAVGDRAAAEPAEPDYSQ